ncbi:MAG: queuosine precursor transporter [Schleiferiaceae bacterium]|nr:queuosine precursor transporter [Schleiferiaceae bacterium]
MENKILTGRKLDQARFVYLTLAALFIAALITCNIIANKFVEIDLGFKTFVISVGVLPYPLTFLITDALSEIYGRKKTNAVVITGFIASGLVLGILWLGNAFNAIPGSIVNDMQYETVFANTGRVILASMTAYLFAQLIDVRLFHFWKNVTKGKHLWVRNNFSTIFSQLADTFLVVTVLFIGVKPVGEIAGFIIDGWLFKMLVALVDTLFIYLIIYIFRTVFDLKPGQEIEF